MKLYAAKVETIANEVIGKLVADGDLEVSDGHEAQLDVASVLKEYLKVDKELNDRTKDIMEIRGLPHSAFGRTKRTLADQKAFGLGEEIYADDVVMRRKMKDILRKHMAVDEELDQEVRQRIKNLQEGTAAWEI